ncbi:alpha/beta fold hydrolase [Streptomyces sp. LP05-1]|uniref:Alpha/beta fold hydrolase n=1 Tax=Streptomyces pyxinae TaxID=2970734 RepID=A0ABT2CHP0_9ACTN|nr:alpha/beta fold hydrolase [Streptomyces sp. LP05-1]MCS0636825.1 alpha/beta fold hydrolase [Streptomyces sp. LP05-1]
MAPGHRTPHHDVTGRPDAPLLVLGPSLGTSGRIWDAQLPALSETFRVLRYDLPGHGGSPSPAPADAAPGDTTVDDLADAVLALVDQVTGTGRADGEQRPAFRYAGISLGGAVGTRLAARHPDRVAALALVCTSAHFGGAGPWRERAALVRREGTAPLLKTSPARWFSDPETARTPLGRALLGDLAAADPAGYAACCDALAAYDTRAELSAVRAPTLVVGGTRDRATPLEHARELTELIPRAGLRTIECGHLAVEEPHTLEHTLTAFLTRPGRRLPI